jgi:hypothetical protein
MKPVVELARASALNNEEIKGKYQGHEGKIGTENHEFEAIVGMEIVVLEL